MDIDWHDPPLPCLYIAAYRLSGRLRYLGYIVLECKEFLQVYSCVCVIHQPTIIKVNFKRQSCNGPVTVPSKSVEKGSAFFTRLTPDSTRFHLPIRVFPADMPCAHCPMSTHPEPPLLHTRSNSQEVQILTLLHHFPGAHAASKKTMPPPPTPTQSYAPNPNTAFFNTVLNPNAAPPSTAATPPRPARPFEAQTQQAFTAAQRSAQARNKAYNISGKKEKEAESFEARQRREEAGRILESMEMLIWLSNARNEVIFPSSSLFPYFSNLPPINVCPCTRKLI